MTELRVLGAFDVRVERQAGTRGALTQPKRLALLLYLALAEPGGLHARDRLLALLWPEATDGSSRHSLRNALHALRHALGDAAIVTRGEDWVGLDFAAVRCDALELRARLAEGRSEDALALWAGDLAPGFHVSGAPDFERWLDDRRTELRRAIQRAAWARARELAGTGLPEIEALRRAARLDPANEPATRQLMRLLAAGGNRSDALRAYQDLVNRLASEMDAEPSGETQALAAEVRAGGAGVAATPAPVPDPTVPRKVPSLVPVAAPRRRRAIRALGAGVLSVTLLGGGSYFAAHAAASSSSRIEAERAVLRLPARYRADTAAYASYLRGLALRFAFRFVDSRDTLAALVNRSPLYVPGLYGLAHAYIFTALNDLTDPDESWPKVDALARRALALDRTAASAWLALASEDMFVRLDLAAAGENLARARTLDPQDPDGAGMQSVWFRFHGRMDSAIAEARLAHRLDPLSPLYARLVGKQLYFARRYEESRRVFTQMLRDNPGWRRGCEDFADLARAMGRPREAVTWLRRARIAEGDTAAAAALPDVASDAAAARLLAADARRTIGRLDRAAAAGDRVPPASYALAWAALGDTLATLRWLDSMVAHRDSYLHQVRLDPIFDFLRHDQRYRAWEARTGLPPLASVPASTLGLAAGQVAWAQPGDPTDGPQMR